MSALDWSQQAAEIPEHGLALDWQASPEQRQSLAKALEVEALERAAFKGRLSSRGRGRYQLRGRLTAHVVQACVVTLDPVPAKLDIPLEIDLVPESELPAATAAEPEGRDPVEAPIAEPIRNGVIDLGDIVFQEIAAALDPYPRHPDAGLDRTEAGPPEGGSMNPFAKLKGLTLPKRED